jgi:hypothetical protein
MKRLFAATALIALLASGTGAYAQTTDAVDPGHPRVNEVDQRLQNQQNRTDSGVQSGQIGAKQEMHDDKADAHVSNELSRDEAKDGGHVTKAQQAKMNRQLNRNSKRIHRQRTNGAASNGTTAH